MIVLDQQAQGSAVPSIWNPNAAANWSLIFTPAFGAYIQMLNWRHLGDEDQAAKSRQWFWASLVMLAVFVLAPSLMPEKSADGAVRGLGLVFLLSWYFSNAKVQAKHVKSIYGNAYPRRGWGKPLGFAVLAVFAYFVVVVLVGVLLGAVQ
jgi:hypothetical protein